MASLQEARAKLMSHFAGDSAANPERWSALWDKGDFLPWDRGKPNPALEDVLFGRQDLVGTCMATESSGYKHRKKALVPGCGRGYDVLLLASFGYDACGLEVSETAVKRCLEEQETNAKNYPAKDETIGAGEVSFIYGDFFAEDLKSHMGLDRFDLIYDYTFLSALPPTLRPQWALRMSQLLAPDGSLICVEFPSDKDPKLGGPPYALPPPVYVQHLAHPGKELPYDKDGHVQEDVELARDSAGLRRIAHWQPIRTHEIGKGQDWISVWKH
ncbi:MAG: hypothetical protein Q9217_000754 [Psora testacea]